jgi:archaellum component FlaC
MAGWTPEQIANWRDPMIPEGFDFGRRLSPGWNPQQPTQQPQQPMEYRTQQPPQQNPWQQPPRQQNPWGGIMGLGTMANIAQIPGQMTGFGEQLGGFGEQMGGFGETLGGYQDLLGGYGEQLGGFGEKLGGFKDEFSGINDKLQNLEQGISSLTDKFGTQQQQQSPYQQNFGMNPFGSFNSYNPYFGGLGAFMRRY